MKKQILTLFILSGISQLTHAQERSLDHRLGDLTQDTIWIKNEVAHAEIYVQNPTVSCLYTGKALGRMHALEVARRHMRLSDEMFSDSRYRDFAIALEGPLGDGLAGTTSLETYCSHPDRDYARYAQALPKIRQNLEAAVELLLHRPR